MRVPAKSGFLDGGVKTIATIASTGAAVASIVTFLHAWGVIGDPLARSSVGNIGARWIGVRPLVDTARTVGDTLHLAATITDKNGSILFGAHPTWTAENPAVATVEPDGSVVARGPGATTIIAVAGDVSARTRIVVHQTVAAVRIAGDSAIAMAEGDSRTLQARAFDARGYVIPPRPARWTIGDSAALSIDSVGHAVANDAGRAIVSVTIDGVSAQALVTVAPSPAAITVVKGDGQRAPAGGTLGGIVVRVVNHRGRPVEGTLVRFRPAQDGGVVEPAAVVTDADGRARTTWSLGDLPGVQRLMASVERVDSAIALVAEAEPMAANTRVAPVADSIVAIAGAPDTIGVRVTDSTGRILAGVPVLWSTLDGAVRNIDARTDSTGIARAEWTRGRKAGTQRARARLDGDVPAVMVTSRVTPAAPAALVIARAKGQAATTRDVGVSITVTDAFGNGVPNATARLHARAGTVAPAVVLTDSLGHAAAAWSPGDKAGEQLLIASVKGATASDTLTLRVPARRATPSTGVRKARLR